MSSAITYSLQGCFKEGKGLSDVVRVVLINSRKPPVYRVDFYLFLFIA